MRRCALAIVLFVLLGAATSIAVAWTAVLIDRAAIEAAGAISDIGETSVIPDHLGWTAQIERRPAATWIWAVNVETNRDYNFAYVERPLRSVDETPPPWSELNRREAGKRSGLTEAASGWPVKCLRQCRYVEERRFVLEWDCQNVGAFIGLEPWKPASVRPVDASVLPVRLIALGFAANTIFYSALWALPFVILHLDLRQRAAIRRKRGNCARCRYDLCGLDGDRCPECGASNDYRPAAMGRGRLIFVSTATILLIAILVAFALVFHWRRPYSPLHYAAYCGDTRAVERLLARGADVNGQTFDDLTPLILASAAADAETIRCLLDAGADVEARAGSYGTALHIACGCSNHVAIEALIAAGAAVNAGAPSITPLSSAAWEGDIEALSMLIDAGAAIETDHWALRISMTSGHPDAAEFLLANGCPVTPEVMSWVVRNARGEMLDLLLAHGGDLTCRRENGETLLFRLSPRDGAEEIWERIIAAGVDVNARGEDGQTALFHAYGWQDTSALEFLLRHGADPTIRDDSGMTALEYSDDLRGLYTQEERWILLEAIDRWNAEHAGEEEPQP